MDENNPVNQGGVETPPPVSPQPIPPSPPVEPTPQGTGKSKVVLWAGLGLLVLALVGVGAYYLGTRKTASTVTPEPVPTQTPTPTPDPTASWSAYRSEEFKVDFKYPPDWSIKDEEEFTITSPSGDLMVSASSVDLAFIGMSPPCDPEKEPERCESALTRSGEVRVDWISGKGSALVVVTPHKGVGVSIERFGASITSEDKEFFKLFLSTFKFIEALPTTTPTSTPSGTITP